MNIPISNSPTLLHKTQNRRDGSLAHPADFRRPGQVFHARFAGWFT
jgi:hypothetical protein